MSLLTLRGRGGWFLQAEGVLHTRWGDSADNGFYNLSASTTKIKIGGRAPVDSDATGTTLTLSWDASTLMKRFDAVFFHADQDMNSTLPPIKREVEALPEPVPCPADRTPRALRRAGSPANPETRSSAASRLCGRVFRSRRRIVRLRPSRSNRKSTNYTRH